MAEVMASLDETLAAAQDIIENGVVRKGLDPSDPKNQVLVAGATVVLAAAEAGLSPSEVLGLIEFAGVTKRAAWENARESEETVNGYL